MAKTGKGLPRSLKNVDFGDFYIPVTPATTIAVGGVKKSATVDAPASITAGVAEESTDAPTKDEFDALVAEYNKLLTDVDALHTTVANLLTALKNAGTVS